MSYDALKCRMVKARHEERQRHARFIAAGLFIVVVAATANAGAQTGVAPQSATQPEPKARPDLVRQPSGGLSRTR